MVLRNSSRLRAKQVLRKRIISRCHRSFHVYCVSAKIFLQAFLATAMELTSYYYRPSRRVKQSWRKEMYMTRSTTHWVWYS